MTALDTMKSALQCSKTEAAKLRIRVRQLEEKIIEAAAVSDLEVTALRQGSEFLVAENARLVAETTRLKRETEFIRADHDKVWVLLGKENDARRAAEARNTPLRDVAAYLLDRGDQYETDSPCWIALADAARNIMLGEVRAAGRNGDFDSALYARVDSLSGKPPAVDGTTSDNPSICGQPESGK